MLPFFVRAGVLTVRVGLTAGLRFVCTLHSASSLSALAGSRGDAEPEEIIHSLLFVRAGVCVASMEHAGCYLLTLYLNSFTST